MFVIYVQTCLCQKVICTSFLIWVCCKHVVCEIISCNYLCARKLLSNIYIFIAIALDESIFLDVLYFPMKNIMSRDLEATPMGEATSKPIQ